MPYRNFELDRIQDVASKIEKYLLDGEKPTVALTLGSGLGGYGKNLPGAKEMPYSDLHLPACSAMGHAGLLRSVKIGKQKVLIFNGRAHRYEGHSYEEVVLGVRSAFYAGAKTHIITCASGGVKKEYTPGQIVAISDHLNLMGGTPLFGKNDDTIGPRFLDMTGVYDSELAAIAFQAAHKNGWTLEAGVYAAMAGPTYETPAEVRMLRAMGADMAGMSTVPEVTALRHLGGRVLGLSCVANHAAGVTDKPLSHAEVIEACNAAVPKFQELLTRIIEDLP